MTIYKRVEIVDGETKEPVQFVALHPFAWPEDYTPTAAFVEDEDATARLTAADALAKAAEGFEEAFEDGGLIDDLVVSRYDALIASLRKYREAVDRG